MREQKEFSTDIIYSDPPYNLGSEIMVRPDGRMDYRKKSDFMNKWEVMSGGWWAEWFKEAYRSLKHGGYCIMFSIDRQCALFKYYAILAGFQERQSLYWFFIQNFPKSSDLGKMLDRHAGAEREITDYNRQGTRSIFDGGKPRPTSLPTSDLAKKYDGYKYSMAALKQTNETILVFQKPYKTGSCLHDTLLYEAGDKTVCCGALNIDGGRVGCVKPFNAAAGNDGKESVPIFQGKGHAGNIVSGRYPSQTFVDSGAAAVLDEQSGMSVSAKRGMQIRGYSADIATVKAGEETNTVRGHDDIGGASKILHKCDFEKEEHDLYFYEPKVDRGERNAGLFNMDKKRIATLAGADNEGELDNVSERFRTQPSANNHSTLKPIALNYRILKLFKTPNPQKILYPFAGVFSEIIGGFKAGFTDYVGCEINPDYIKIGEVRLEYWKHHDFSKYSSEEIPENQQSLF